MSKRLAYRKKIQTLPPASVHPDALEMMGLLASKPMELGLSLLGDPTSPMEVSARDTPDMDRAYEAQDLLNNGLLGAGAGVGMAGIFLPETKKNTKPFTQFRKLERAGATPEELQRETLIHRSPDNQRTPLLEVDDNQMEVHKANRGYLVSHPALEEAMPGYVPMRMDKHQNPNAYKAGYYNPNIHEIGAGTYFMDNPYSDDTRKFLSHELQHAVQNLHGMEPGSNVQLHEEPYFRRERVAIDFAKNYAATMDTFTDNFLKSGQAPDRLEAKRMAFKALTQSYPDSVGMLFNGNTPDRIKNLIFNYLVGEPNEREYFELMVQPQEQYMRVLGESQARLSEGRSLLDTNQRAVTMPFYDRPEELMIRWEDTPYKNIKMHQPAFERLIRKIPKSLLR